MGWTLLRSHQREFLLEYVRALKNTPQTLRRMAFRRRTLEEELSEALLRGSLRKAFSGFDLFCLGLGIVIGTGWGLLSGLAAKTFAGPAVLLSYLFSGLATLLTAACFAELAVEFPVSGGAFSYIMVTFGELPAFVTLGGLLLEYAVGMAAVARGFSRYLVRLCNSEPSLFVLEVGSENQHSIDFMAAGIILFMSVLLSIGVRESALFITSVTVLKIVLIVFVSIVGYTRGTFATLYDPPSDPYVYNPEYGAGDPAYTAVIKGPTQPFFHPSYGGDGVFLAAAVLFFTYVGYDAICNAAEEARHVEHVPLALMGTAGTSTLLYTLLALSLVLMTRPNVVAPDLPQHDSAYEEDKVLSFITAFVYIQNLKYMQYITAMALLLGIITALTVGLFSLSRIVMAASRDWLLPPFLARISKRTQTPLVAQMVMGVIIAIIAMLVETQFSTGMVSFGTLITLWVVCNAQMWRRYIPDLQLRFTRYGTVEVADKQELASWALGRSWSIKTRRVLVAAHVLAINALSIALGAFYARSTDSKVDYAGDSLGHDSLASLWFLLAWLAVTLSLQLTCPLSYRPEGWHVPRWLMPWLPSTAIAITWFSIGALPDADYWKSGAFFGGVLLFYLLFSLPMSYIKHSRVDSTAADGLNIVELTFVGGQWRPHELGPMFGSPPYRVSAATSSVALSMHGSDPVHKSATDSKSTNDSSSHRCKLPARPTSSMPLPARHNGGGGGGGKADLSPRYSGGAKLGPPARAGSTPLPPMQEEEG
ncbi:hypothetical protein ABPG75_013246 [Micractinium tetrahymenae]